MVTDHDVVYEGDAHPGSNQHSEPEESPGEMFSHCEGTEGQSEDLKEGGDHGNPSEGDNLQQRLHSEARRVHEHREDDDGQGKVFWVLYNDREYDSIARLYTIQPINNKKFEVFTCDIAEAWDHRQDRARDAHEIDQYCSQQNFPIVP